MRPFTEKEKNTLDQLLESCDINRFYNLDKKEKRYKHLVAVIDKLIFFYGVAEYLDENKDRFKIVLRPNVVAEKLKEICKEQDTCRTGWYVNNTK